MSKTFHENMFGAIGGRLLNQFFDEKFWIAILIMLAPAFEAGISDDCCRKAVAIINFYHKYKHMCVVEIIKYVSMILSSYDPLVQNVDHLLAFKLNFWPNEIQPFLQRLKKNRPLFYDKIKDIYMHVIPK